MTAVAGGHLWWRRWAPSPEFVTLWIQTPDHDHTDVWIVPDELDNELDDWDQGTFMWIGETYQLTWLGDTETQAMRRDLEIKGR